MGIGRVIRPPPRMVQLLDGFGYLVTHLTDLGMHMHMRVYTEDLNMLDLKLERYTFTKGLPRVVPRRDGNSYKV